MDAERPKKISKTQLGAAKKLRSACDFCHQTKVKCSGGNPCNGCEQLSIDCIYSASNRIGRPKGSRNKKTIERVKRYKLENEQRQKAQQAAEQTAAVAADAPPRPALPLSATTTLDQTASMAVDWPTPDTLDSKIIGKPGTDDLFTFPCDTTPGMAVDPVYSLYNADLDHELPDFDFGPDTTDQLPISDSLIAPILHDIDGSQFNPFVDSEPENFIDRTDHPISTPSSPALTSTANDSHRAFSMASITSPSTPLISPGQTPALTSSSSVLSAPNSSCTCLQDQASLLSRLASTSLISAPLPLDAALECAQQATRTWELFLRCRQCSFRLFESKFDSYLVLTSSMRIILNILNDQLQHFEKPAADRSSDALATCDNNATSPGASTISSSSHSRTESRSWMLGMYETSCFENQLISATLLLKIASSIVNLSERLVDVTNKGSREPFSLDSLATKPSGSIDETGSPTSSKLMSPECSYLTDHDMDDSAMGFNLKFLQQKAQSNDRSAKRFKEDIHARMRHLV